MKFDSAMAEVEARQMGSLGPTNFSTAEPPPNHQFTKLDGWMLFRSFAFAFCNSDDDDAPAPAAAAHLSGLRPHKLASIALGLKN